jgi:hypothetical protein
MGAALDSFVMIMGYAGIVTLSLLGFCLITRFSNKSGKLPVYQRLPLLLPAIGFVITVMLITGMGITPMAQYQGANSRSYSFESGDRISFTLKDNSFYAHSLEAEETCFLNFNESIYIEVTISQDGVIVETFTHSIQYSSVQTPVISTDTTSLSPGTYDIQVDFTRYEGGLPVEGWSSSLFMTFTQPLTVGYIEELVDWTSFQFTINISCIAIFLGGLCSGTSLNEDHRREPRRREPRRKEPERETSEYDW